MQCWYQIKQNLSRSPSKLVAGTVALTVFLFAPVGWNSWVTYLRFNQLVTNELRLQHLSDRITYLDEVLTMSARMNAATGDQQWEQRYHQYEPELDTIIKESIKIAPDAYDGKDAKQTDIANLKLVDLETQSFELVNQGKKQEALALLLGTEYQKYKQLYAKGVANINSAIAQQIKAQIISYRQRLWVSSWIIVSLFILLVPAWILIIQLLRDYLHKLLTTQNDLEEAHYTLQIKAKQLEQTLNELQQTQAQLIQTEKMSSIGQFVAGIAHEINNPISFIHGNLQHAEEYTNDLIKLLEMYQLHYPQPVIDIQEQIQDLDLDFLIKDFAKVLASMRVGTTRIKELILSLRNFSRLDEAEIKIVDLHQGLDNTLTLLRNRLEDRKTNFKIRVIKKYNPIPLVGCYPSELNQVFFHLLNNAIDAIQVLAKSPTNLTIEPEISIETQLINNNWIRIIISDNGCGIPEEIKSQIWNPFFTTKVIGQGTGLGLTVCYQIIVQQHQGKIDCDSRVGQGTKFYIEIPVNENLAT